MNLDGSSVNLVVAFVGGIVTFFASCLLPLVPTYIAFLSGMTLSKPEHILEHRIRRYEIFLNSLIFVIGFVSVFILLGLFASSLGQMLALYRSFVQQFGGVFLIATGLFMLGILNADFLYRERKVHFQHHMTKWRKLNSLLFGLTFGFAWTPCIGPVLAVILFWASQQTTYWQGVSLLMAYGFGLGLPFLVIGFLFETFSSRIRKLTIFGKYLNFVSAGFLILTGILLILGKLEVVTIGLMKIFNLSTVAY